MVADTKVTKFMALCPGFVQDHDGKTLRDVINVLLKQLDISWMDTDLSLTQ